MTKVFAIANRFCKDLDLTEVALVKVCAAAFGVLVGLGSRHKKSMGFLASLVLIGSAIPLLAKLLSIITTSED